MIGKSNNTLDAGTASAAKLFIAQIALRYPITQAILFGSRARGDHRQNSDADIAILLSGLHGNFIETKLAMSDIAYDILLETGIHIQPLPIWEDEWQHPESYSNPQLLQRIQHDGVRL